MISCRNCLHHGVCQLFKEAKALSKRLSTEVACGDHEKTFNKSRDYDYKGFTIAVTRCPIYVENPSTSVTERLTIKVEGQ